MMLSPNMSASMLRELADRVEKGEALVTAQLHVEREWYDYKYWTGEDRGMKLDFRQCTNEKNLQLEIRVCGPIEWQNRRTGRWEIIE